MSSAAETELSHLTLPPITGLVLQRLGVDGSLFTVQESLQPQFPTPATSAQEWEAGFKGYKESVQVSVGDVVTYRLETKKRKRGKSANGDLKFGLVRSILASNDVDTPPSYTIERLGRLTEVLGPAARQNDLYYTGQMHTIEHDAVTKLVPSTYRLRVKHDEVHAVWTVSGHEKQFEKGDSFARSSSTWLHDGMRLHVGDCVRMDRVQKTPSGSSEEQSRFAQILKLEVSRSDNLAVQLVWLDPQTSQQLHTDTQPLVRLQAGRKLTYEPARWSVVEKVQVWGSKAAALDWIKERAFVDERDVFFVGGGNDFKVCEKCEDALKHENTQNKAALRGGLRSMSLFSGAGGEAAGFSMDGFIQPSCAIDLDPLCGLTSQTINPGTVCITADLIKLVRSILTGSGDVPSSLPPRNSIDVMTISSPCQGFSKANYHRSGSDPRNLLVAVALAMVELYLPTYIVLENVLGMLEPGMKLGHECQGAVKLILITLIELGYSVSMQTVQAASYGSPSHRHRAIFLASRNRRPLPVLPSPTHEHDRRDNFRVSLFPRQGETRTYSQSTDEPRRCKLFPARTLWDAISDLPAWDWLDPHDLYIDSDRPIDLLKRRRTVEDRVPAYDVTAGSASESDWRGKALGPANTSYRRAATNSFQDLMRGSATSVMQHQTARPGVQQAERVCNVPFRAGASAHDFTSFDVRKPLLWDGTLKLLRTAKDTDGDWRDVASRAYQRMDAYQTCWTIMTEMHLHGKWGSWVHPRDARVLSVRELARAQGFPDKVVFGGRDYRRQEGMTPSEAYKQVGNAVPPLVARAVGRAIAKSHVEWVRAQAAKK